MFEEYYKARNIKNGEIKLFDSGLGRRLFLKDNPDWRGVGR